MNTTLALPDQFKTALELVARTKAIKVIKTKEAYETAEVDYKAMIVAEKKLKIQWDELEIVIEYKKLHEQKLCLESDFKAAKKYIKDGPMKAYDDERERIRQAEERRLAEIARKEQEAETARLVAEQKAAWEKSEAARKVAEAAAKKAEAAAAAAAKKGNEEAAALARQQAQEAREKAQAEEARQAQARQEAAQIKQDAAAAPAPVVVVEKSHTGVTRRKVYKYRLTLKDGRKLLKADFTASTRIKISDVGNLPSHLYVLSPVLLNEFIDSQGEVAAIPGVLEIKAEYC